jgi:hypothetical protein
MSPGSDYRECGAPSRYVCRNSGQPLCEDHAEDIRKIFGKEEPLDPIKPPATVDDIIRRLQTLPPYAQKLPVFFRPKYNGDTTCDEEVPVNPFGISVMVPPNSDVPDRVVFLC